MKNAGKNFCHFFRLCNIKRLCASLSRKKACSVLGSVLICLPEIIIKAQVF
jgi:hypothetical protein